jgi:hypothetical protein
MRKKKPVKKKPVAVVLLVHDETLMERIVRWFGGHPVKVKPSKRKTKAKVRPVCL